MLFPSNPGSYHGNTGLTTDVSAKHFWRRPNGQKPRIHVLPSPEPYRSDDDHRSDATSTSFSSSSSSFAGSAAESAKAQIERISAGGQISAFISEALMSHAGMTTPPPGYLSAVYGAVRAAGGVCIADEVQIGFGRVGEHFWAFQCHDVTPDIVTIGKPLGTCTDGARTNMKNALSYV